MLTLPHHYCLQIAGIVGAVFGLMNICCRSVGGFTSDTMGRWFGEWTRGAGLAFCCSLVDLPACVQDRFSYLVLAAFLLAAGMRGRLWAYFCLQVRAASNSSSDRSCYILSAVPLVILRSLVMLPRRHKKTWLHSTLGSSPRALT